jgi:pyruvate,orthophosphate dikinase
MIEFPRAAMIADELAKEAEFMSFGSNDLTQTTLGFSRDDYGRFVKHYIEKGVFEKDPFQTIDQEGVGKIMKITITKARGIKNNIDMGICGEHGGDPASVKFCHRVGLSNVSCSPYRVPIATLAAAQAVIEARKEAEKNRPVNNKANLQQKQNQKPNQNKMQKPNQQKPQMKVQNQKNFKSKIPNQKNMNQARSIREEIRAIIRQELSRI